MNNKVLAKVRPMKVDEFEAILQKEMGGKFFVALISRSR
jgi:hypothetical protein